MSSMPILPVDAMVVGLDDNEAKLVRAAFTTRGVSAGGRLRANKPFRRARNDFEGRANYVWRMLCFDLVGHGKHACMPVCAEFDVCDGLDAEFGRKRYTERAAEVRVITKELDDLATRAARILPPEAQKGIMRWGRALGMV
jgi:hypothetical protein